jgi:heat shock protein HslJ
MRRVVVDRARTRTDRVRRAAVVAAATLVVVPLAACSSGDDDATTSTAAPATTSAPTTTAEPTSTVAGGAEETDSASSDLVGSAWRLVAIEREDGTTDSAADGVAAIVTFEDETTVGIYDGVNFTSGTYRLDGSSLAVDLDPPSEIEYPERDLVQYELIELLDDSTTLTVSNGELAIELADGGSLRLESATSGLPSS